MTASGSDRIVEMAGNACVELLRDYGVELTASDVAGPMWEEQNVVFGVIGFVGNEVSATCVLGAEQSLVEVSCRAGGRPRDWIAELSNQLAGRVKMKLLACGMSVRLTTPLALSGVRLTPLPRLGQEPLTFESDGGKAFVWLEIEADETFTLGAERPLSVEPGGMVF
jgi:hypothetical protein